MCPALRCGVMTAAQMVSASEPSTAMRCRNATSTSSGVFSLVGSTDLPSSAVHFHPFEDERTQAAAGCGRCASPLVIMAHTTRAILLANATAATFRGRRCTKAINPKFAFEKRVSC
jgi:hypothetical protein